MAPVAPPRVPLLLDAAFDAAALDPHFGGGSRYGGAGSSNGFGSSGESAAALMSHHEHSRSLLPQPQPPQGLGYRAPPPAVRRDVKSAARCAYDADTWRMFPGSALANAM